MAISKTFNGKKYLLTHQFDFKAEADKEAKYLRSLGYLARVVKTNKAHKYHLYRSTNYKSSLR